MRLARVIILCATVAAISATAHADVEYTLLDSIFNPWNSAEDIAVVDEIAYVALGDDGLAVVDLHDPSLMTYFARIDVAGGAWALLEHDGLLHVAAGNEGLRIFTLVDPYLPAELSFSATPGWARSLEVREDLVYVGYGEQDATSGVRIINVSDPGAPYTLSHVVLQRPAQGMKLRYPTLYVAAGSAGLVLVNVSNPANPAIVSSLGGFLNAGSVDVFEDYAYVGDVNGWIGIVNVLNPGNLYQESSYATLGGLGSVRVWSEYNEAVLCYADAGNLRMLSIDIPIAPEMLANLNLESDLSTLPRMVYGDHTLYLSNGTEGIHQYNADDLANPILEGCFYGMNQIVDVVLTESTLFAVDKRDGLRVISLEEADLPEEVGGVPHYLNGFVVQGDRAYGFSDDTFYGYTLNADDLPEQYSMQTLPADGHDLAVRGTRACVALGESGIRLFDVNGNQLIPEGSITLPDSASADAVDLIDNLALVVSELDGLFLFDISVPNQIVLIDSYADLATPRDVVLGADHMAYVAFGDAEEILPTGGLATMSLSYDMGITLVSMYEHQAVSYSVDAVGQEPMIRLANGVGGVTTLNLAQPGDPYLENQLDEPGVAMATSVFGDRMAISFVDQIRLYSMTHVGVEETQTSRALIPALTLYPAFPNPFNAGTTVRVELDHASHVQLTVYDLLGREVVRLVDRQVAAGTHRVAFNAVSLASGSYWLQARDEQGVVQQQRITLVR